MTKAIAKLDEIDEFSIFATYVASELRNIPDIQISRKIKNKLARTLNSSLLEVKISAQ